MVLWESFIPDVDDLVKKDAEKGFAVHRLKGRIVLQAGQVKMVQGVREVFEITDLKAPPKGKSETIEDNGKLVLIGRGLSILPWEQSLARRLNL